MKRLNLKELVALADLYERFGSYTPIHPVDQLITRAYIIRAQATLTGDVIIPKPSKKNTL